MKNHTALNVNFCCIILCSIIIEASFQFPVTLKNKQTLVVSGYECYLSRKNNITTNWNCSKAQPHKCWETAFTDWESYWINCERNHDFSTEKPDASLVSKNTKDLRDKITPTVAVETATQPIIEQIATQLALAFKKNLTRTIHWVRKQRDQVLPVPSITRNF